MDGILALHARGQGSIPAAGKAFVLPLADQGAETGAYGYNIAKKRSANMSKLSSSSFPSLSHQPLRTAPTNDHALGACFSSFASLY